MNESLSFWFRFSKTNCNIDRTLPHGDNQIFEERETKGLYFHFIIDESSLSHTHNQIYIAIHLVTGYSRYQSIVDALMM